MEVEKLKRNAQVIRGLISYHKRMLLPFCGFLKVDKDTKDVKSCADSGMLTEKGECPSVMFANDIYLGALEEALRLMEEEIVRIGG